MGVVIVDHGSRKKDSNDMLLEFCGLYRQVTGHGIVEAAHMEIAEPTIEQAIGGWLPWCRPRRAAGGRAGRLRSRGELDRPVRVEGSSWTGKSLTI